MKRETIQKVFGAGVLALLAIYILAMAPMPFRQTIWSENSPDGKMTAVYSSRPAGLAGWFMGDGSYAYLDVYDSATQERVLHFAGSGDLPYEAVHRLHKNLPWPAQRTLGRGIAF